MLVISWLCQKQSTSMKDFEICWRLNSRSKGSESPNTYSVSVLSLWRMGFHSLNANILKKSYALSPSTEETRSTPQWSTIRLQESFPSEDEKFDPHLYRQLIGSLIQLATRIRPDISYSVSILSRFFSNTARRQWTLAWREVNFLKTTQDSVLYLSSEQGGPVTNSPMLKAAGNLELLTFTDSDFASYEETIKSRCVVCSFL